MTHFKSKFIKTKNLGTKSSLSLLEVSFGKGDLSATLTKQVLHEAEGRTNVSITSPALRHVKAPEAWAWRGKLQEVGKNTA